MSCYHKGYFKVTGSQSFKLGNDIVIHTFYQKTTLAGLSRMDDEWTNYRQGKR